MSLLAYIRSLVRRFIRPSRIGKELDEEVQTHIQLRANDLERSGLTRPTAERQARIEFGSTARFKEECREALGGNFIHGGVQDVRFALRTLRKSPAFVGVAIMTFAVGIGATVAAFSVVNAVLLRPFAFTEPKSLFWIYSRIPDNPRANFSLPEYCDYRDQNTLLSGLAAVGSYNVSLAESGSAERAQGLRITANAFEILGVRALVGRTLIADDDKNGARPVVLISYGLWSRRYARDNNVVGRAVNLDGRPREIVGVLPPDFVVPNMDTDVVVPLQPESDPRRNARNSVHFLRFIGRLKPGVTANQGHAELDSIRANLSRQYPEAYTSTVGITMVPLAEEIVTNVKPLLLTIFAAAAAVLLIGSTNLAGIFLSRAAARQRELGVRAALGATRTHLVRLLLVESFILAIAGSLLGVLLQSWGRTALLRVLPSDFPRAESLSIDGSVVAFAIAATSIAAFVCGLAPAWLLSRCDLREKLAAGGRGSTGSGVHSRLRTWLVTGQVALALVLLANAGVLFRSFARISKEEPGFDSTDVFTARLSFPQIGYPDRDSIVHFYETLYTRLSETPGARDVALVSLIPLSPKSISFIHFSRPDAPPAKPEDRPATDYRVVSPNYFRAMGIPLLSGRYFTDADNGEHSPVVIVSATLAKNHFRDRSPVGQRLLIDDTSGDPRPVEIVGVVGPVKQTSLEASPRAGIYLPLRQVPSDGVPWLRYGSYWVMKMAPGAPGPEPVLRGAVRGVDANVAISLARPMTDVVAAALAARRFTLFLVGAFAGAAIFLAAAGLYGVIAYEIQQRTPEIGVRLALGATRANILAMILREGSVLLAVGITVGLAIALLTAKLVASQMYGISERDPSSFAVVSLLLAGISLLACLIACRRAVSVDPIVALRAE